MFRSNYRIMIVALLLAAFAAFSGCRDESTSKAPTTTVSTSGSADKGKIPVTTTSDEAKKEYLLGRDLAEKLRLQDSIQHFDKAISLDPNFALAELGRANSSQTGAEFFEHLKKAVGLAGKASEGEKLLILANEANSNGDVVKQKDYLDKLVAAFPNDERAHFSLGAYYQGQQDVAKAIEHYKKATELNANYSPVYNSLGYAYSQTGDYPNAEQAFKKYIELIPNDPNPYDSYGELLLKMGKFEDSIVQYRKALSIDANFSASHSGIAADLMYLGKPDEARAELQKLMDSARSDGDRATALFGMTVLDIDSGEMDKALKNLDKQYELAEKRKDAADMSGNLQTKGTILVEMGKFDDAKSMFERSVKMNEDSDLPKEVKDNAKLFHHYNMTTVALGMKDIAAAKTHAEEFRKGADASKNPGQMRQAHELAGMIAFAEKDYDKAIAEFAQASQQNPRNLYRLAEAYQGKGDSAKAKEFSVKAAAFNSLPQIGYSFIRAKAKKMADSIKAG